jgi:hypothetical protein
MEPNRRDLDPGIPISLLLGPRGTASPATISGSALVGPRGAASLATISSSALLGRHGTASLATTSSSARASSGAAALPYSRQSPSSLNKVASLLSARLEYLEISRRHCENEDDLKQTTANILAEFVKGLVANKLNHLDDGLLLMRLVERSTVPDVFKSRLVQVINARFSVNRNQGALQDTVPRPPPSEIPPRPCQEIMPGPCREIKPRQRKLPGPCQAALAQLLGPCQAALTQRPQWNIWKQPNPISNKNCSISTTTLWKANGTKYKIRALTFTQSWKSLQTVAFLSMPFGWTNRAARVLPVWLTPGMSLPMSTPWIRKTSCKSSKT